MENRRCVARKRHCCGDILWCRCRHRLLRHGQNKKKTKDTRHAFDGRHWQSIDIGTALNINLQVLQKIIYFISSGQERRARYPLTVFGPSAPRQVGRRAMRSRATANNCIMYNKIIIWFGGGVTRARPGRTWSGESVVAMTTTIRRPR